MTSVEIPINGVEVNSEMDWSSNQLNKFIGQIAANVHEVENECPVVGLAGCHLTENSKIAGTSSWPSWISRFTGSFVGHSPSEMLCPPAVTIRIKSFTSIQMFHTHTPPGGVKNWGPDCEVKMRMTGRWKWDENEDGMKIT